MDELDWILAANEAYTHNLGPVPESSPRRHLTVLTCMDTRVDPLAVLGLQVGDAQILRNAGGRVTGDVLRSLALSVHVLGVRQLVVMEHTKCGIEGVDETELRRITGAAVSFLPIDDHVTALGADVALVSGIDFLEPLEFVAGLLYDVDTGRVRKVTTWKRPASSVPPGRKGQ